MFILVTSKNGEDLIKNEVNRVLTTLINNFSNTQWQLTLQSRMGSGHLDPIRDRVVAKNDEDPIKNEGARISTTLNIFFSKHNSAISIWIWSKF